MAQVQVQSPAWYLVAVQTDYPVAEVKEEGPPGLPWEWITGGVVALGIGIAIAVARKQEQGG